MSTAFFGVVVQYFSNMNCYLLLNLNAIKKLKNEEFNFIEYS